MRWQNMQTGWQVGVVSLLGLLMAFAGYQIFLQKTLLNWTSLMYAGVTLAILLPVFLILEIKLRRGVWLAGLIPVMVIISGKGLALLAVLLFILACAAAGLFLYSSLFGKDSAAQDPTALVLAFFLGLGVLGFLVWIAMHFKINYRLGYWLAGIALIMVFGKPLAVRARLMRKTEWSLSPGQSVLLLSGIFYLVYALVPFYLWDGLIVHLNYAKSVLLNGYFVFHPREVVTLDTAVIPRGAYTAVFMLGGEYAIRLFNFALFFLGFTWLEKMARDRFGAGPACWTLVALVTTPFVLWQMGAVFIDSFQLFSAIVLLTIMFRVLERPNPREVMFYFIAAGVAYLYKQHAILMIIPIGLVLLSVTARRLLRDRDYRLLPSFFWGGAVFLLIVSTVWLHNYILSGNPLFPYFNGLFQSDWLPKENFADTRWQHPLTWKFLYDITFRGTQYVENMNLAFGIGFFVLVPLWPLLFWKEENRSRMIMLVSIFVLAVALWIKITNPYIRYFVSILPVGALLLGLTVDKVIRFMGNRKILRISVAVLCALVFMINLAMQLSLINFSSPYPVKAALTGKYEDTHLQYHLNVKKVFDFANAKFGRNTRVLLVGMTPFLYFVDGRAETLMWYHYRTRVEMLLEPRTADELYTAVFQTGQFDYLIMPAVATPDCAKYYDPEFLSRLREEISDAGYTVYSRQEGPEKQ